MNAREEINFGGPNFDIEDYAFANFAAEYEVNSHLKIFARVDNLFDEKYQNPAGFDRPGLGVFAGIKLANR